MLCRPFSQPRSEDMEKPMRNRRSRSARTNGARGNGGGHQPANVSPNGEMIAPGTTGRYLVLLREDAIKSAAKTLRDTAGLKTTSTADFAEGAVAGEHLAEAEAL